MGLTNIVDTNTNDSALLKQNFHPPRALFRLLDTLSQIIIAIKFATKLEAKHRDEIVLSSFQSISWSSFYQEAQCHA